MSRSFYSSHTQKKVVDAIASKRSQIAITNSRRAGEAKAKANRERKLGIAPPPAQFQSAADAAFDVAHSNQLAISNLESFMYPKDALNAFGDLLKHNQINEFNQYVANFKHALGDRKISYIEFINYWQIFVNRLQDELNQKALYLTPAEKDEFEHNEQYNLSLEPGEELLPITRHIPKSSVSKLPAQERQDELKTIFASNADIDSMNIGKLREYIRSTLNPSLTALNKITHLKSYTAATVQELRDKVKDTQGSVHARVNSVVRKQAGLKIAKALETSINRKKLEARIKHRKQASSSNDAEIGVLKAEIDRLSRQWSLTPDYEKSKKDRINDTIMATKAKLDALRSSGAGINHKRLIRGRGLYHSQSISNMKHRFKILSGEVQAGNDNPAVVSELYELIDILQQKNMINHI